MKVLIVGDDVNQKLSEIILTFDSFQQNEIYSLINYRHIDRNCQLMKSLKEMEEDMFFYLYSNSDFIAMIKWLNKQFWADIRNQFSYQAISEFHQHKINKSTDFKRRIHCRKEICRKHQRDLPGIRAQEKFARMSTG